MVLRQPHCLVYVALCRALEEPGESAEPESRPAVAVEEPAAVAGPAVPNADFVESAVEADARVVAPAERSDEHSARAAESAERPVAKSDCSTHRAVLTDYQTTFVVVVLEARSLLGQKANTNSVPNRFALGTIVAMQSRKAVQFHRCRKAKDSSEHTDRTSFASFELASRGTAMLEEIVNAMWSICMRLRPQLPQSVNMPKRTSGALELPSMKKSFLGRVQPATNLLLAEAPLPAH